MNKEIVQLRITRMCLEYRRFSDINEGIAKSHVKDIILELEMNKHVAEEFYGSLERFSIPEVKRWYRNFRLERHLK